MIFCKEEKISPSLNYFIHFNSEIGTYKINILNYHNFLLKDQFYQINYLIVLEWRGINENKLIKMTKIQDCIFCHNKLTF